MKAKTQTVNIRPVLIMVLALTCSISSIAWLNPEIKNGKVIIKNAPAIRAISAAITAPLVAPEPVAPKHKKNISIKYYTDSTRLKALNDTVIKNKKYKIVIEDENGTKKEYNSVNELPAADKNDFLKDANAGNFNDIKFDTTGINDAARKFGESFKQYNSVEWKKQAEVMQKKAMAMAKQFDSPEWKRKQKALVDQSIAMAKKTNSQEWKKQSELLSQQAEKIARHFDSPEWKKQQEEYAKMGEDYVNSPEWKKQQEEIVKASLDLAKQFTMHFSEKEQRQLEKQAEEIGKQAEKMTDSWNVKYKLTSPKDEKLQKFDFEIIPPSAIKKNKIKSITLDPPPAPAKVKKIKSITLDSPPAPAVEPTKPEAPEKMPLN